LTLLTTFFFTYHIGYWCAAFDYEGYDGEGGCWYNNTNWGTCNATQLYISECKDADNQQFTFVPLANDAVLIQPYQDSENRCLERFETEVELRTCDAQNSMQQWIALNGSFDDYRFEISMKGFTSQCMASSHHPKAGEVIEMYWCEGKRESETSFWEPY